MKFIKAIVLIAVLGFAVIAGWKVGSSEVANIQLQEDLHDLAGKAGVRIGNYNPPTDDEFRADIIRKAQDDGIQLRPEQVTVERTRTGVNAAVYLAADYTETIDLPGYSFVMHFTPSSTKHSF